MNDAELLEALSGLLPPQFEIVLVTAGVKTGIIAPAAAAPATRATELLRWAKQTPSHRQRLLAALAQVLDMADAGGATLSADPSEPPARPGRRRRRAPRKVLFLAAEPLDAVRLRLGKEFETIRARLNRPLTRGHIVLASSWAVSPRALNPVLLAEKPHVLHFSGHGSPRGCLCLEGDDGQAVPISPAALTSVIGLARHLECVVLNACHAEDQAAALARCVPYVVGARQDIDDEAALAFSEGFYAALAAGRSIVEAHAAGRAQLLMLGFPDTLAPALLTG